MPDTSIWFYRDRRRSRDCLNAQMYLFSKQSMFLHWENKSSQIEIYFGMKNSMIKWLEKVMQILLLSSLFGCYCIDVIVLYYCGIHNM